MSKEQKILLPDTVDFEMRGGNHPDQEMDGFERGIASQAYNMTVGNPVFAERGYKWAYNWVYFHTIWQSRDPRIINLWYRLEPYPRFLEVEATQACHLKCIQCENTYWDEPKTMLSFDDYKRIVDQFPDLVWCSPNGLGDPFLNKDFWRMLEYDKSRGTCGEIYSNTSLLKPSDMGRFVDLGLEYFKFSIDAATKETYEKVRVGIDYDVVIDNLVALHEWKLKRHSIFPKIHIHYLVMKDTVGEAKQMLDFLHSLKIDVDEIMYSRLLHNFPEIKEQYIEFPPTLGVELQEYGRKLGIKVTFNEDSVVDKPPANECLAFQMPYIFPDGTVIPCCCMNEQNRRQWQRDNSMGNIFQTSFREIWYGERYNKLRRLLREGHIIDASPMCAICNIYDGE